MIELLKKNLNLLIYLSIKKKRNLEWENIYIHSLNK